ncbi:bifunctional diaminohydroxyphosphoribosylaminopyrimidine deaminase/5-amino-6-(5-phosphoribosylamino)uracil reductase RibD [Candidatus Peregrinibacteria bacterium]|nr:bifunctional diaminohydroxyphosphoribosylaminopyrimidine deaminase/5-amino-6-(5-phosphoribosylamino)uracil reductase RibD [Candidatus Peregrinibacteria bacterium]
MINPIFMHRCLELAEGGQSTVGNGALVGSVLVRDGKIIAEGFHDHFGSPHAERMLLNSINQKIYSDDVLYVNLEPCCHHGKTPPCTDLIIKCGVKHVVIGMSDPDPRVSGKGIAQLRAQGVTVTGPVLRSECEWLNRGFISVRTNGRPWITLKRAQTRDGQTSNADGSPLKITSKEQDIFSHTFLRATHDAILTGVGTIIADDSRLDLRFAQGKNSEAPQPWRIILDPHLRIPLAARVVTDPEANRTMIVTAPESDRTKRAELLKRSVRVIDISLSGDTFDWPELWKKLITPEEDYHGLTSILVEGGVKTWEAFGRGGFVDLEAILTGA